MADTYSRSSDVQVGSGYRELPDGGATWGPDLKTIVYAGVGVFFGILAGTSIADGSWRSLNFMSQHHTTEIASSNSTSANRASAKIGTTKPHEAQALEQGTPKPSVAQQSAAAQSTTAQSTIAQSAAVQSTVAPQATTKAVQSAVTQSTVAQPTGAKRAAAQSTTSPQIPATHKLYVNQQASGIQRTNASHRHRLVHRVGARRKHFGRRRVHIRHRLRAALKTAVDAKSPPNDTALKSSNTVGPAAANPSAFTIHGEVTVFNYDSTAGIIETYEGETFVLDRTQSLGGTAPWDDYVPNIHYQCDQFGNCTLNRGGGVVLNARRTR